MTFEVILNLKKYLCIHNVTIHINIYQNQFIDEFVKKNFPKVKKDQKTFFLLDVE